MSITISIEFLLTLITTIIGGIAWISSKLEKINASIAQMHTDFVSHDTCKERQGRCPCVLKMERLEEELKGK